MKIVGTHWVLGQESDIYEAPLSEIRKSIVGTKLVINPTPKGNGVKPIKDGVVEYLEKAGWDTERPMDLEGMRAKPLDGFKEFRNLNVGLEWETGNISSSFRALMKLIKGLIEDQLDLGVHVLPSRELYTYLTDRVGNIAELVPYLSVFSRIKIPAQKALIIIVVEHDSTNKKAKLIPKGSDGMSLERRSRK